MKVLQLSHKPPYPPVDGGSIAINNISMGLAAQGVDLKLISINTPKHRVREADLPEDYLKTTKAEFVFVDTNVKVTSAFTNLFSGRSYHLTRFYSPNMEQRIVEELNKHAYDIILLESIYLSDYLPVIRKHSKAKLVMRSHNIEYLLWKRVAEQEGNPLKRAYLKLLAGRLEKEELTKMHDYDAIVCVSANDQAFYEAKGYQKPICSIPIGMDITKDLSPGTSQAAFPGLFMLGALDWIPNQEGIMWFLDHVWSSLRAQHPEITLKIAGRRPSVQMLSIRREGVEMLGEIDDAASFIKENAIMLVPLFSGSGIRVKIIEGMMMGKVIVTTPIGAEGIPCTHRKNILIAKDEKEFVSCIQELIADPALAQRISSEAVTFARDHFSHQKLNTKLTDFFSSL